MPNDVSDTVHRFVAASKQAGGITFTDKDGNVITDDNKDAEEETMEDGAISIPTTNMDDQAITGVEENNINEDNALVGDEIEGKGNTRPGSGNNTNSNNTQEEITGVTEEDNSNMVTIPEEERDPDEYITLENINITSEMNTSNRLLTETENEEASEITGRTNE